MISRSPEVADEVVDRRDAGKSKSEGNPALVIGGIVGAVVVVGGIVVFVMGRPAAPPPGGFAPNGTPSTIASNPSPPPAMPGAPPGTAPAAPANPGSRFDQTVVGGKPSGGVPNAPANSGPKNPSAGIGLGNVVGVTKHWRNSAMGQRDADRKSTRLNSSHIPLSRMPSSA